MTVFRAGNIGIPNLSRSRAGSAPRHRKKHHKVVRYTPQGPSPRFITGKGHGISDTDKLLNVLRDREANQTIDPRYQNPDGTMKSVAEIQLGFANDDRVRKTLHQRHRVSKLFEFSHALSGRTPGPDGFIDVSDQIPKLAGVLPGVSGVRDSRDEQGNLIKGPVSFKARVYSPEGEEQKVALFGEYEDGTLRPVMNKNRPIEIPTSFLLASAPIGKLLKDQQNADITGGGQAPLSEREKTSMDLERKTLDSMRKSQDKIFKAINDSDSPDPALVKSYFDQKAALQKREAAFSNRINGLNQSNIPGEKAVTGFKNTPVPAAKSETNAKGFKAETVPDKELTVSRETPTKKNVVKAKGITTKPVPETNPMQQGFLNPDEQAALDEYLQRTGQAPREEVSYGVRRPEGEVGINPMQKGRLDPIEQRDLDSYLHRSGQTNYRSKPYGIQRK